MIDINECIIKPIISRDVLKDKLLEEAIYCMYMNTTKIELNKAISSPLRDDPTPSFGFFKSKDGSIIYNDFVKGGGDCFMFVKEMFGYNSWYDVYSRIAIDFNLNKEYRCNENLDKNSVVNKKIRERKITISRAEKCLIQVSRRPWQFYDYEYWKKFNIDSNMLNTYNVKPVKYIFINKRPIGADKHAYVYSEMKDNQETLKIYQPYSKYKWFTNNDNSVWQGWTQLPKTGEKLIITKSLKDVMSIVNTVGIPAIALQNEKAKPKDKIIEELKSRFNKIFVLFDNDYDKERNWGQLNALDICKDYNLKNILIDEEYKSKDFSDLVMNYNKFFAKEILKIKIK